MLPESSCDLIDTPYQHRHNPTRVVLLRWSLGSRPYAARLGQDLHAHMGRSVRSNPLHCRWRIWVSLGPSGYALPSSASDVGAPSLLELEVEASPSSSVGSCSDFGDVMAVTRVGGGRAPESVVGVPIFKLKANISLSRASREGHWAAQCPNLEHC